MCLKTRANKRGHEWWIFCLLVVCFVRFSLNHLLRMEQLNEVRNANQMTMERMRKRKRSKKKRMNTQHSYRWLIWLVSLSACSCLSIYIFYFMTLEISLKYIRNKWRYIQYDVIITLQMTFKFDIHSIDFDIPMNQSIQNLLTIDWLYANI